MSGPTERAGDRDDAAERRAEGNAGAEASQEMERVDPASGRDAHGITHCDLCGAPMLEWHCRLVCAACGFQRDCSDP